MKTLPLFPCTIVGSYPQPDWLIDRQKLSGRFPPRTRAKELWRVAPEFLGEAQRDATGNELQRFRFVPRRRFSGSVRGRLCRGFMMVLGAAIRTLLGQCRQNR